MLIGKSFKATRKKRKLSLSKVSKELNLSLNFLDKLENDDLFNMPNNIYTISFIRSYSEYLGLDTKEILKQYKSRINPSENLKQEKISKPIEIFYLSKYTQFASLFIIISISAAFYLMFIENNKEFQFDHAITSELPIDLEAEIEKFEVEQSLTKFNNIKEEITNYPKKSIKIASINKNYSAEKQIIEENQKINNNYINVIASNQSEKSIEDLNNLISLKATKSTWIQLRNFNSDIVFSKLLTANEVYNYSIKDNLKITTGNAGNIIVSIGGETLGKLGKKGEILDSVKILPNLFSN